MARMRQLRAGISQHDSAERFRKLGVDVYIGHGRFAGPSTVEIDGKRLEFHRAVIATGARAAELPIPGLKEAGYYTNETIFTLTELPRRLVVIGTGPIGCELAQSFRRFGSEVTAITDGMEILPKEDQDAAAIVRMQMDREGVRVLTRGMIKRVSGNGAGKRMSVAVEGNVQEIDCDAILVCCRQATESGRVGFGCRKREICAQRCAGGRTDAHDESAGVRRRRYLLAL